MCTIFSLYAQDIAKLTQHNSLPKQASIAMHRSALLCLYSFPSLSDRKSIGLQQQLSSGSHWPQSSTSCISVGRGQVGRWPMGGLYPGEHGTVSYLNPTRIMCASGAERLGKKAKGRRNLVRLHWLQRAELRLSRD